MSFLDPTCCPVPETGTAEEPVFTAADQTEDSPHVSGDTGSFILAVRNDGSAPLTSTNGDYSPIAVDSAGRLIGAPFTPLPIVATVATLANVPGSVTSVTLRAANSARLGLMVFNDSTATLFIKFGATASATSFTVKVAPDGYYEFPQPIYVGIVDGIWDAANGNARVTETTP